MTDDPEGHSGGPPDDHVDRDVVDARPFAVAAVIFVIVAVLAVLFLGEDDDLRLLLPERFERIDDDTFRAVVPAEELTGCEVVERAQVGLDDDAVFVELVVSLTDACRADPPPLRATITLPEPIGERRLLSGAGPVELPCERQQPMEWVCGPDG